MICKKCGQQIQDESISFCPNCNSYLKEVSNEDFSSYDMDTTPFRNDSYQNNYQEYNNISNLNSMNNIDTVSSFKEPIEKKERKIGNIFPYIVVAFLWIAAIYLLFLSGDNRYFFRDNFIKASSSQIGEIDPKVANYEATSKSGQTPKKAKVGVTSIVYDNQYLKQTVLKNVDDVYAIIVADSLKQKTNCPADVVAIENNIINNYGIKAINFCEMDKDFAEELENVIAYIYNEFPEARNHMTNITLANVDQNATFMAAFMPIFTFATSNTKSEYPVGVKTQIILNAKYFLDSSKIESSASYGSKSGFFPPNATRSSTVAHEFGHYLSYVALMKHYNTTDLTFVKNSSSNLMVIYNDFNDGDYSYTIINEAYLTYKRSNANTMSFDQFRASISKYAVTKDKNGNDIYDETIAEAFHDCYLNGDNAKLASKLIMDALKDHL